MLAIAVYYIWRERNVRLHGKVDTVQPCDTTQVRSYSNFGVKSATVQVYGNSNNS
jgi:hypothetical protein